MVTGTLLGSGRVADVYAHGEGQALKLFQNGTTLSQIEQEATVSRAVFNAGLPVPATGEVVSVGGHFGIIFERLEGPSMLADMSAKPWKLVHFARLMAELHVAVHDVVISGLPSQRKQLRRSILESGILPANQKEAVLSTLDRLPDSNRLTHGDFHPDNIVMTPDGPVIVDWATARQGDPAEDVARTSLLLSSAELPPGTTSGARLLISTARGLFNRFYLRRYFQLRPAARRRYEEWLLPVTAARLGDGIGKEQDELLKQIAVLSQTRTTHRTCGGFA